VGSRVDLMQTVACLLWFVSHRVAKSLVSGMKFDWCAAEN